MKPLFSLFAWLVLACLMPPLFAQRAGDATGEQVNSIRFEAFVRSDLPAAKQVATYVDDLRRRVPGLEILVHDVLSDREQLIRLHRLTKEFGKDKAVVPSFYCCNRMYFGFADAQSSGPKIENMLAAEVYTRDSCPKCQAAKLFIGQLKQRWPAIQFRIHEVTQDVAARLRWEQLCRSAGQLAGLPTIEFAGHIVIGYQGDAITGKQLEELIEEVSGAGGAPLPKAKEAAAGESPDRGASGKSSFLFSPTLSSLAVLSMPQQADVITRGEMLTTESNAPQELNLDDLALPGAAGEDDIGEGAAEKPPDTIVADDQGIKVPWFGTLSVKELGLPAFTFAVGLIDGFNPCAMWVLVFLLSVLVNVKDRRKILAIAGTFVVVSGIAYFAFMAAWLNLFMLIGIARPVQILLGCFAIFIGLVNVKDFFAFKKGISLSIPESSKPGLYRRVREIVNAKYLAIAIGSAITLAIVVNLVELLCTAGLPALYTQILTLQELPAWVNYMYLGLYISAYMLDDTVMLMAAVVTLSHRKLQEKEGRWLKLISGLVILVLGLVMILRPTWLELAP